MSICHKMIENSVPKLIITEKIPVCADFSVFVSKNDPGVGYSVAFREPACKRPGSVKIRARLGQNQSVAVPG